MAKRHKIWARRERTLLKLILGGHCAWCNTEENLEFDCIIPQGDAHHKLDTSARMSFYRRQYALQNLQLLCSKCNSKKADKEYEYLPF